VEVQLHVFSSSVLKGETVSQLHPRRKGPHYPLQIEWALNFVWKLWRREKLSVSGVEAQDPSHAS